MSDDQIKAWREKIELRRQRRRAELEADFLKDSQALDRMIALDGISDTQVQPTNGAAANRAATDTEAGAFPAFNISRHPAVGDDANPATLVREAIGTFDGEFTKHNIESTIRQKHPKAQLNENSISGVLNKMRKRREIIPVKDAIGRAAAIYRRPPTATLASIQQEINTTEVVETVAK